MTTCPVCAHELRANGSCPMDTNSWGPRAALPSKPKKPMTVGQVATALGISHKMVYQLPLKFYRPGDTGWFRISRAEFEDYVHRQPQ